MRADTNGRRGRGVLRAVLVIIAAMLLGGSPLRAQELADPAHLTHAQLMRAVFRLTDGNVSGTGFLLSRPDPAAPARRQTILVTANHVFENMTRPEVKLMLRQREPDGAWKRRPTPIKTRDGQTKLWTKHATADVAVLPIELPAGADAVCLPVEMLASDRILEDYGVGPGDAVLALGYPHAEESSEVGFAIMRRGAVASFPLFPVKTTPTFLVDFNTFEGDSGGLVVREAVGKSPAIVLGVVIAQRMIDDDLKTPYESWKLRHRLGLAITASAALVTETLAGLPQKSQSAAAGK